MRSTCIVLFVILFLGPGITTAFGQGPFFPVSIGEREANIAAARWRRTVDTFISSSSGDGAFGAPAWRAVHDTDVVISEYDVQGRIVRRQQAARRSALNFSQVLPSQSEVYQYDHRSRLRRMESYQADTLLAVTLYTYDTLDRLTLMTTGWVDSAHPIDAAPQMQSVITFDDTCGYRIRQYSMGTEQLGEEGTVNARWRPLIEVIVDTNGVRRRSTEYVYYPDNIHLREITHLRLGGVDIVRLDTVGDLVSLHDQTGAEYHFERRDNLIDSHHWRVTDMLQEDGKLASREVTRFEDRLEVESIKTSYDLHGNGDRGRQPRRDPSHARHTVTVLERFRVP